MNSLLKFCTALFLFIVSFADISISIASTLNSKQEKPTLEESKQLLEDTQYLLSDKEIIDYEDPRLNEILNKYSDKYNLFKIYKAFIEFDKSDKTTEDVKKAKNILLNHFNSIQRHLHWSENDSDEENTLRVFLSLMSGGLLSDDIAYLLPGEREENVDNGGYKYIKIPLWLVMKYPDIINMDGIHVLTVNAKNSIKNLKEFHDFMLQFSKIHGGYLTPMHGHQKISSHLMTKNFISIVSFSPDHYIKQSAKQEGNTPESFKENMLYAEQESYLSIEHRVKYERLLQALHKFSSTLSQYYQTHYSLSNYADQTDIIISKYVHHHTKQRSMSTRKGSCDPDYYDPTLVNFIILFGLDKINNLKQLIQNLGEESKSEFLRHAVLANADLNFIKWLLYNGADPNYIFYKFRYVYPLMVSFRNIDVMQLLIDSGADINASNRIGETALFYAIKFNNLEAVKILIDNGANVNANTNPKIRDQNNTNFINTSLIYARRYASKDVVALLIKHGAKDGPADPEKVKKWIAEGPLDL